MSWKALTWAGDQRCRTSAEKFVLVVLANHADEQHTCYPSVESLAATTQLGTSTVRRCITNLTIDGKIRVLQRWGKRGSRRSNRYQLLMLGADTPLPEHDDWQREYEYVPRPKDIDNNDADSPDEGTADIDGDERGRDADDKPLGTSTMSDQGDHAARSEHTARSERYMAPGSSGINRSDREVTSNRNEPPVGNLYKESPPPSGPELTDARDTSSEREGGEDSNHSGNGDRRDELEVFAAWFDGRTTWNRTAIVDALTGAVAQGRGDLRRCATALRELAEGRHGVTGSPRRLLRDGPWWTPPAPGMAGDPRARREGPRCRRPHHGREPADGCIMCAADRKAADGLDQLPEVSQEQREAGERALATFLARRQTGRRRRDPAGEPAGEPVLVR